VPADIQTPGVLFPPPGKLGRGLAQGAASAVFSQSERRPHHLCHPVTLGQHDAAILTAYQDGMAIHRIAAMIGCYRHVVKRRLKVLCPDLERRRRPKHPVTLGQHDALIMSAAHDRAVAFDIAAELGCGWSTVKRRLAVLSPGRHVRDLHPVTLGQHDAEIRDALASQRNVTRAAIAASVVIGCGVSTVTSRIGVLQGQPS
jgi:hypothetical protein